MMNPIPIIPDDIIPDILLRLPVKSLMRFSCVSKTWCSLISSSRFTETHLEISKSSIDYQRILLRNPRDGKFRHCSFISVLHEPIIIDAIDTDYGADSSNKVQCVGSCDGLICLAVDKQTLILWNPSTRKLKRLPHFDCESSKSNFNDCGFGYDKASDDYKVLTLQRTYSKDTYSARIYSLKSDQWKSIKSYVGCFSENDGPLILANGKLHWLSMPTEGPRHDNFVDPYTEEYICARRLNITYLALETEYGLLEKPNYVISGWYSALCFSEGCLYALCSQQSGGDLWMVGRETWRKIVTIPNIDGGEVKYIDHRELVYTIKNGEILLNCGSSIPNLKFAIFNPKDGSFKCPQIRNSNNFLATMTYVESLVSPIM